MVSLDGFVTTIDQTPQGTMSPDRLTAAHATGTNATTPTGAEG